MLLVMVCVYVLARLSIGILLRPVCAMRIGTTPATDAAAPVAVAHAATSADKCPLLMLKISGAVCQV